jgi:hypothetical protein
MDHVVSADVVGELLAAVRGRGRGGIVVLVR